MKKAGIGTRVMNFLVDTLLIFFISWGIYEWRSFYVYYYHVPPIDFYIVFWITLVIYYMLFEAIFARTPGKWLSISKVVTTQGRRPALWQVIIRSVLRATVIDCFFIPFLNDRTLHDYASQTMVIEA
ncbi:MAG TPA: RDD family protein [Chitinophagaceae bacterium]|jgi:uncharacterized RDD family membrane protein YckC|nr:RDD family protein [Chitinophagaceae bacterium]